MMMNMMPPAQGGINNGENNTAETKADNQQWGKNYFILVL
jgi:hypothetical protein